MSASTCKLSITLDLSLNAIVTWIHGPWYAYRLYEGLDAKHGMSKDKVDIALAELRREGLIENAWGGDEPEVCIDTHRGQYLKSEFCALAAIDSPPDADAGTRLARMFAPSRSR